MDPQVTYHSVNSCYMRTLMTGRLVAAEKTSIANQWVAENYTSFHALVLDPQQKITQLSSAIEGFMLGKESVYDPSLKLLPL